MGNNNFEKQVREKMNDLKILPSSGNWSAIEQRIRKRKIDRRVLWFFILAAALIAGVGYFGYYEQDILPTQVAAVAEVKSVPEHRSVEGLPSTGVKNDFGEEKKRERPKENTSETNLKIGLQDKINVSLPGSGHANANTTNSGENKVLNETEVSLALNTGEDQLVNLKISDTTAEPVFQENINFVMLKDSLKSLDYEKNVIVLNDAPKGSSENKFIQSGTKMIIEKAVPDQENIGPGAYPKEVTPDRPGINYSGKLSWGLTVSGGKVLLGDGINLSFFDNSKSYEMPALDLNYQPGFSQNYVISRPAVVRISRPQSSFGFNAGLIVKRNFSPCISLLSGLNYKYQSNTIQFGSVTGGFYDSNNLPSEEYRNNLHFVEVPLLGAFRLNKKGKVPFHITAGPAVSYLLVSDAVEFERGYFVRDGSSLSKVQMSMVGGVSATFFNRLSIGPSLHYGISKMAGEGIFNNKHSGFLGVKLDYMFKK